MIAHPETQAGRADIWSKLAAPLPAGVVSWRQDGKPIARDGRYFARFVAYIEANTVRERLDSVVPGEWDLTLELLPPIAGAGEEERVSFKARLQILGVIREDVGVGKDYKQAATDAFKRVAVRFGIAHELYAYEQNWVQVDGDGKYAKALEDPQAAYERRYGNGTGGGAAHPPEGEQRGVPTGPTTSAPGSTPSVPRGTAPSSGTSSSNSSSARDARDAVVPCPKCGGPCWDNRASKRNPRAPDFKCRDRSCDGVIWPPRNTGVRATDDDTAPVTGGDEDDTIPF